MNSSNNALIEALDWVGVDAYPYFQTVNANSIENSPGLFFDALSATQGAAMGKPVWVTETGWPVTGAQSGQASAGTANAEIYWKGVACKLLGSVNTWWYQLNDGADQATSFKVINPDRGAPLYDLSCPASSSSSSAAARSSTSAVSSAAGSTASSAASSAGVITASGTTIVVPTGTPSGRPSSVSGDASASTAVQVGSPNDNNQNAGTVASQPSATAAGTGTSGSSGSSNGTTPATYAPSATTSTPSTYTGAAIANAPAVGLLLVGAIMAAL